jgi:hypothetical protein
MKFRQRDESGGNFFDNLDGEWLSKIEVLKPNVTRKEGILL